MTAKENQGAAAPHSLTLTAQERKRLAASARRLAMRCLNNGPEMTNEWCGCAIGLSLKGAGLMARDAEGWSDLAWHLERRFSAVESPGIDGILSEATRERTYRKNPTAVVIPLLAWADELDAAPAAPKEPQP